MLSRLFGERGEMYPGKGDFTRILETMRTRLKGVSGEGDVGGITPNKGLIVQL